MKTPATPKELGKEYVQQGEKELIAEFVSEMKAQVDRMYEDKFMKRQVHTKMHGCVKATLTVMENLPENLKIGVFSEVRSYDCWVRFSNASTVPKPDAKKDIRGCAIKLLNVPGEKLLEGLKQETTQDFLLMSSETFFSKSVEEFKGLMKAATAPSKYPLLIYFLNPKHWSLLKRFRKSNSVCDNPLSIPYWSTQPYRFGADDKAVKYLLRPAAENQIINENFEDDNYLQVNLAQTLNSNSATFDFCVQFQQNAETMPIEDPTVPWKSPFKKIATLVIQPQHFTSPEQQAFGENLSFNPWHSLPEHRPLGGFNRARKVAYIEMSRYRHSKNHERMVEPSVAQFKQKQT